MNVAEYAARDALSLAALVRAGEISATDAAEAMLAAAEHVNPRVNAIIETYPGRAAAPGPGVHPSGPFAGVPFLLKDLVSHEAGQRYELGSRLAAGLTAPHDTELVRRFRAAGLNILGRTTTAEFGFSPSTEPLLHGPTRNPWDTARTPGGSSGGSAAAVATGIVPVAHANDGGGSNRVPASACGIVGLKPTRGRTPVGPDYSQLLSGWGIEFAFSRTIRDSAALLDAVEGPETGAFYAIARPPRPYLEAIATTPRPLRLALNVTPWSAHARVDPVVRDAVTAVARVLEGLGHRVEEARFTFDFEQYHAACRVVWASFCAAGCRQLAALTGRTIDAGTVEPCTLEAYELGCRLSAADLAAADSAVAALCRAAGTFFERYDVMLTPTWTCLPPPLGVLANSRGDLTLDAYLHLVLGTNTFTSPINTTGQPAISLPLSQSPPGEGHPAGLPIGSHFIGRWGDEATLLQLAAQLETALPWRDRRPPLHAAA
ncbi:MAG: amidase [Deltaproteobacteria bacterium]|nr:amidase [Deltaproteobacteria bacterium]